jgi:hypothetical protein
MSTENEQTIVGQLPRELLQYISFLSPDLDTFASLILTHRTFSGHHAKLVGELKQRFTVVTVQEIYPHRPDSFYTIVTKTLGNKTQIDEFVLNEALICTALKSRTISITSKRVTDPEEFAIFSLIRCYSLVKANATPHTTTRIKRSCWTAHTQINDTVGLRVTKLHRGWKFELDRWKFEHTDYGPSSCVQKWALPGDPFESDEFFGPEGKQHFSRHFQDEPELLKIGPDWEKVAFGMPELLKFV